MNDGTGDSREKVTAARAELDRLIETIGPERAQEMMELLLTEIITEQDPEAQD